MKKLVLLVLLCASFVMVGCQADDMESAPRGVLQRRVERDRRITQSFDLQNRGMVDDLDYILFLDRVSRTSEGYLYCGW